MENIILYGARTMIPFKEQDDKFLKIQKLIEQKQQFLMEKQTRLRNISKQNRFLEHIRNDYSKYYNYIAQQKKDQIRALEVLNTYIEQLTLTGELTKYNIEDAKKEQQRILREMNSIKHNLDEMIGNVDETKEILNYKIN